MKNLISKSRVEAFSDGIFAIIITLLVLEIKVPHIANHSSSEELMQAFVHLLPKFTGWIISFFTVAVIWVNHHKMLKQMREIDNGIFWLNALLLLWTSFIPFPTAVLGDYPSNPASVVLYGVVMSLMALSFTLMRWYALRHPVVLNEEVNIQSFKQGTRLSLLFGPVTYLLGVAAGFVQPWLAFAIFLGIPVYFIFSDGKSKLV